MDAYIGEVRAYPYPPNRILNGWLRCDGSLVNVQQYQALYALLGNMYGGTTNQTFGLPNLQCQAVVGMGTGPGLTQRALGNQSGAETVTLTPSQLPSHNHQLQLIQPTPASVNFATDTTSVPNTNGSSRLMRPVKVGTPNVAIRAFVSGQPLTTNLADSTLGVTGGLQSLTQPHENRQPALVLTYWICYDGIYPVPA